MEGEDKAFDELLSRHSSRVFTYIFTTVKDEALADDLFQDVFIKVIEKLRSRKYEPTGSFAYWLTRLTHNLVIDYYRSREAEHIIEIAEDNDLENINAASVLSTFREEELVREQVLRDARHLMEALPPEQREVVYMRLYQQIPFKEIARITGVSINTSLGRMRYAVLNMRRMAAKADLALKIS